MPLVQLPDGTVAQFPDSMSNSEIEAALQQHEQSGGAGWGREAEIAGAGLVRGLASTLGLPGQIAQAAERAKAAAGYHSLLPNPLSWLPSGEQLAGLLPEGPAPAGTGERLLSAAAQGVGGALPLLPLGGASAIAPTLSSGATGGMGAELGHEIAPQSTLAPLVGGLLGGAIGGAPVTIAQRGANYLMGELGPQGQLFETAGIPMRSPAYTTETESIARKLGQYAPAEPTMSDIGQQLDLLAGPQGSSRSYQEAGQVLQDEARRWHQEVMPQKEAAAWEPVQQLVPPTTPVPLDSFRGVLTSLANKGGGLKGLISALPGTDTVKALGARLKSLDELGELGSAEGAPMVPNWADARALRSAIGDAMRTPSVVSSGNAKTLEPLYAGLTKDLRGAAGGVSPDALGAFDAANAESTRLNSFNRDIVAKIIKNDNPAQAGIAPEASAKALLGKLQSGATDLQQLRAEIPAAADELSAAHLRNIGLEDLDSEPMGSPRFASKWQALSPEAKVALVPDPAVRAQVDALGRIAGNVKRVAGLKPTRADQAAEVLAGGGLGALTAAIATHGNPLAVIAAEGAGNLVGLGVPALFGAARSARAGSPLLARYQAAAAPAYGIPYQPATAALLATNPLLPRGGNQ